VTNWVPQSWQAKKILQAAHYQDPQLEAEILAQLTALPPLVTPLEINKLRDLLREAEAGRAFVMQGGDCSEQFADCTPQGIQNKFKILLQMSVILLHGLKKPIIRVGRVAGQYAKPRSQEVEIRDGVSLPAYRGDIINAPEFTLAARTPNPLRMLDAYFYSATTLNYLRALADDGFADLHHPEQWVLEFMEDAAAHQDYQAILRSITEAICFFESVAGIRNESLQRVALYSSHEALHLPYESALTQQIESGQYYNLGTHFPWIGMRTLALEGAHIEYLRGIQNPLGIKVGPEADLDELLRIIDVLNPERESGKIMLIHRSGAAKVEARLPVLLSRLQAEGMPILWTCDPMHGNTKTTQTGVKTRYFEDIVAELKVAFAIHRDLSIPLGGIHFEMTGENVTECIGGACGLSEADLPRAYKSLVDPRLNYQQAMEIALQVVSFA
jgi:3-deoxy-7-phosphoheptulonate synthase